MARDNKGLCRKKQILRKTKDVSFLFENKKFLYNGKKLRAFYATLPLANKIENSYKVQVLFSVPKRSFAKATLRNRLKRLMFETYRINRQNLESPFFDDDGKTLLLGVFYKSKETATYNEISEEMLAILNLLNKLGNP